MIEHWPSMTLFRTALPTTHNLTRAPSQQFFRNISTRTNMPTQRIKSVPCTFYRGGTSNGLVINSTNLPQDQSKWEPILSSAMGSPDSYGRQLNGMGAGVSSTSKVMVVSPPTSKTRGKDVDLEYTFVQVGIRDREVYFNGNCGNMSSAVAPFGVDEGMIDLGGRVHGGNVTLRMWNENTNKIVSSTLSVRQSNVEDKEGEHPARWVYEPCGNYMIDGVPGSGSRITLGFLDPAGAKTGKALPTGNPIDTLTLANGRKFQGTMTDIANPAVFVPASDIGVPGDIPADTFMANTEVMNLLEELRQAASTAMRMEPPSKSVPFIVLLSTPTEVAAAKGVNIVCRALSMQQAHKAVPLTVATNLGASCRIEGTLPAKMAVGLTGVGREATVTIGHASGILEVGSVLAEDKSIESALLHRTARPLMKGEVFYVEES